MPSAAKLSIQICYSKCLCEIDIVLGYPKIMSQELSLCNKAFPCPCCGHMSFDEKPGSYDICPICFWEDDAVQLQSDWWDRGGANIPLRQAQRNYAKFGAEQERLLQHCRAPVEGDLRDLEWRPLPEATDDERNAAPVSGLDYFNAVGGVEDESLYYWRKLPRLNPALELKPDV